MLDAKVLGQLLLMQSIVINLPDESSIFSFVCRGLVDLPGVIEAKHFKGTEEIQDSATVRFPLKIEDSDFGEIQLTINDYDAYLPYQEYLKNFIFMIKIILEERNQRQLNILHQALLEERVEERTEQLSDEIKERKQAEKNLKIALTKYKTLFNIIPIGVTVSGKNGKVLETNKFAEKLLGLPQEEHTLRTIDDAKWHIVRSDGTVMAKNEYASVRALKEKRLIENVEMGVIKPDGEITWLSVTADLIPLEGYGVIVTYSDISERKQSEENLKHLLTEKEILLAEVHHRVKNNLQVITSLLNLQAEGVEDIRVLKILEESRARIQSMTLVHEQLYRSPEYTDIDFGLYADQLASTLFSMYHTEIDKIHYEVDVENVKLDLDRAIPCGLLLNELITNSLKYAFPEDGTGKLWIKIKIVEDSVILQVGDNGVGLPANIDIQDTKTLGLQLVNLLVVHDLHGRIVHEKEGGTQYRIEFPKA